jgi:integrase
MEPATTSSAPRLLDEVRRQIRIRHYAYSTERTYVYWTKFFVRFHRMRHPREMGAAEVEAFLSYLASDRKVSASTQNQAKAALLFLYKAVLGIDLPWLRELVSAQGSRRLPVVLTRQEVKTLLEALHGTSWLIANLLYGTGMRVIEGLRVRARRQKPTRRHPSKATTRRPPSPDLRKIRLALLEERAEGLARSRLAQHPPEDLALAQHRLAHAFGPRLLHQRLGRDQ